MEDFEKKVSIKDSMDIEQENSNLSKSNEILNLLRKFLEIQQRRAQAYSKLKTGFSEYMKSGGELAYQQLCREITVEFNDCSKQVLSSTPDHIISFEFIFLRPYVLEMESLFLNPDYCRVDLAELLRAIQTQEKQKLHLTAMIQVLKKAGRPSERLVNHENCSFKKPMEHECVHLQEITEAAGTEEAEANAEYDNAVKEAIRGVQDAVTAINEHLEEVRYEIAALETE
ncbi:DNA repair REX1-B protein [Gossypium australe]|uniref:DNA repair REX1-B protein n=1 Tax=Gossypium australe TaxID=47621 RepID=A0A5B6W9A1_9ROSI|nr:DNA repair REX1-B protein [Gossypium australe]